MANLYINSKSFLKWGELFDSFTFSLEHNKYVGSIWFTSCKTEVAHSNENSIR